LIWENRLRFHLFDVVMQAAVVLYQQTIAKANADPNELNSEERKAAYERGKAQGLWKARNRSEAEAKIKNDGAEVLAFFWDRIIVQQKENGISHDIVAAMIHSADDSDLVRLLARVHALQAFIQTEDGANLHAGYKRAANILKKEDWHGSEGRIPRTGEEDPLAMVDDPDLAAATAARMELIHGAGYTKEPAEAALVAALDAAEPAARAAVAAEDFAGAMRVLAGLRAPIDAFFDQVTVNDADANKRAFRLDLLVSFRDAVHNVADFSRIEG